MTRSTRFPLSSRYEVIPRVPFPGQYGPIPFDDPWWKVLLLIIAIILLIAAALSEATDVAYNDEDLVIGHSVARSRPMSTRRSACSIPIGRRASCRSSTPSRTRAIRAPRPRSTARSR